ncbi:N/A [soil metagenome]
MPYHKLTTAVLRRGLTVALLALSGVAGAEEQPRGRALVETCLGCHGIDSYMNAYPNYHVPKLGGQNAEYIVAALRGYKAEDRPHPTMHSQAATLTAEEMQQIGRFFEQAAAVESDHRGDAPAEAAACVSCHGEAGVAPSPAFPHLAGQYADYLARSLRQYKSGERRNPIMAGFAAQLGEEDIEELAAWYARQSGLVTPGLD